MRLYGSHASLALLTGCALAGCSPELELVEQPLISCSDDSHCPDEYVCLGDLCRNAADACVEALGDDLAFVENGRPCTRSGLDDGVCVDGECAESRCGDGIVHAGVETCDDGNNDDCTGDCFADCSATVALTGCGDGVVCDSEDCDDGNNELESCTYGSTECVVCDGACVLVPGGISHCGDGVIAAADGEGCDDGNTNADDGCDSTCRVEAGAECNDEEPTICSVCGNHTRELSEDCDDGNLGDGDGCDPDCELEAGWGCWGDNPSTCVTVRYVDQNATGVENGHTWETAFDEVQEALAAAVEDSAAEVWVAAGTYEPSGPLGRGNAFRLGSNLSLVGGFAGGELSGDDRDWLENPTVLSGDLGVLGDRADNSYHVLLVENDADNVVIDGFAIIAGNATDISTQTGGGIDIRGLTRVAIRNCRFEDNFAVLQGGALRMDEGDLSLENVTFLANEAGAEGGALFVNQGNLTGANVEFRDNSALLGGAVAVGVVTVDVVDGIFADNSAGAGTGGALQNDGGLWTVTDSSFTTNLAGSHGGAARNAAGLMTFNHCQFDHNSAGGNGGAVRTLDGIATFIGCHLADNQADGDGGALSVAGGRAVVVSTHFADNLADEGGAIAHSSGDLSVVESDFARNSATRDPVAPTTTMAGGGAVKINGAGTTPARFLNCRFYGNTAVDDGGALLLEQDTAIVNCAFVANDAVSGAAIFFEVGSLKSSTLYGNSNGAAIRIPNNRSPLIENSILWGNSGGAFSIGMVNTNPEAYSSCIEGGWSEGGDNNISTDPMLSDPAGADEALGTDDDDLALSPSSPAIDAGDNPRAPLTSVDLAGGLRVVDYPGVGPASPTIDMGAYEAQPD